MSTHNICFYLEIRKILCGYPLLSGATRVVGRRSERLGLHTRKILGYPENIFLISPRKTYVVGTHLMGLGKALLMSTHNICFCGEIRKTLVYTPLICT